MDDIMNPLMGLGLLCLFGLLYFAPSIVAHNWKHRNTTAIVVLNVFAGWTVVGWIVALVWACTVDRQRA